MGALEKTDHLHPHLHLHGQEEEEEEEALSLCDLPLDENNGNSFQETTTTTTSHSNTNASRRTSSSSSTETGAPDFFEFLSNLSSEMCAAEDLIFCGKLIPLNNNEQNPPPLHHHKKQQEPQHSSKACSMSSSFYEHKNGPFRRRSESLSELQSSRSKSKILRSSRSLDYQKLHRVSSSNTSQESDMERNSSVRSVGKSDNVNKIRAVKPRWYLFMFGMVKFPPEMDLRDIKTRQFRRNSSVMFPPFDSTGNFPVNRSSASGGKTSWRFLKALSCKDDASVSVTTPLCMPHA